MPASPQVAEATGLVDQILSEYQTLSTQCDAKVAAAQSTGVSVPAAIGISVGSALVGALVDHAVGRAFGRK
jgi:hypothetical protein